MLSHSCEKANRLPLRLPSHHHHLLVFYQFVPSKRPKLVTNNDDPRCLVYKLTYLMFKENFIYVLKTLGNAVIARNKKKQLSCIILMNKRTTSQ